MCCSFKGINILEINRQQILAFFLRIISHISDIEYQERVWIRGEGPEVDDFDETVCHFFDDGDPILKNYKDYGITDAQYHLLITFRTAFETFIDSPKPYLPEDFINTAEWRKIIEMAKEVLEAFNYTRHM